MNKFPQDFLDILARHGRDLKSAGVDGVALPKGAALDALRTLGLGSRIPILGGDVFRVVNGAISLSYENWDCKSTGDPTTEKYLKDSLIQAEEYIRSFPDPEDGTVFYQLVFGESLKIPS